MFGFAKRFAIVGCVVFLYMSVFSASAIAQTGSVFFVNNASQNVHVSVIWGLNVSPSVFNLSPGGTQTVFAFETQPAFIISFDSEFNPQGPGEVTVNDGPGGHLGVFADAPGGNINLRVNKK